MAKNYQEILQNLKKEELEIPYDAGIPDELGPMREAIQPGSYRFQFPPSIDDCWGDPLQVAVRDGDGKVILDPKGGQDPKTGQPKIVTKERIQLIFEREGALTIIQSPRGEYDNEPFSWRLSNVERPRFAGQNLRVPVSDMTYLLRALAPEARPKSNQDFVQLCLNVLPAAKFGADAEWSAFCNPDRESLFAFPGEAGETVYEPAKVEGTEELAKGCGARLYMSRWPRNPKDTHRYAERAPCPKCGAILRPFANLARFRA